MPMPNDPELAARTMTVLQHAFDLDVKTITSENPVTVSGARARLAFVEAWFERTRRVLPTTEDRVSQLESYVRDLLRTIPARDTAANVQGYGLLKAIAPQKEDYVRKHEAYLGALAEAEAKAKAEKYKAARRACNSQEDALMLRQVEFEWCTYELGFDSSVWSRCNALLDLDQWSVLPIAQGAMG